MKTTYPYSLFEVFGVELEYMIVDQKTLKVKPIADQLLFDFSKNYSGDFENGTITWSNELVGHVIELKVSAPVNELNGLADRFHENIITINQALDKYGAMILPTASHPFFNPDEETVLWPHEHNEIYELYNKVFNCSGHGWSNLQSVHLNLPFKNDQEFAALHAAIRIALPLIPGLAASSPILDSKATGYLDARMHHYLNNQKAIPSLMGQLIPEAVYTFEDYHQQIFNPIIKDFKPYDTEGVMEHHFLNSRGAIARFDRGAIEIRVTDLQECPKADIAILIAVVELLKKLVQNHQADKNTIQRIGTDQLAQLFRQVIKTGEKTIVTDHEFLSVLGIKASSISIREIWKILIGEMNLEQSTIQVLNHLLEKGTLSTRIVRRFENGESLVTIYKDLARATAQNILFQ